MIRWILLSIALLSPSWINFGPRANNDKSATIVMADELRTGNEDDADQKHLQPSVGTIQQTSTLAQLMEESCIECHGVNNPASELNLESLELEGITESKIIWEKVVRKLQSGQMPPSHSQPVEPGLLDSALAELIEILDQDSRVNPNPGRTATFRRITRFEYQNAIRDLLGVTIDSASLLPADEISHGFDNVTVEELPPALINRYVSAAQRISRLAVGNSSGQATAITIRLPPDRTQEEHVHGLPLGTRGGINIPYDFPNRGKYQVTIRLTRDRNEHVEGLKKKADLDLLVDNHLAHQFSIHPPRGSSAQKDDYTRPSHDNVDQHLNAMIFVEAGHHELGITFPKTSASLLETKRQPLDVHYNMYRHPRINPAIFQVSIRGPIDSPHPEAAKESSVRSPILSPWPENSSEENPCAVKILTNVMRRAYRRTITNSDLEKPLRLFEEAANESGFESGIEFALSYLLISPEFLFRIERDPPHDSLSVPYQITDLELASRLSFFLWGSIPDDQLLQLAESDHLHEPSVLRRQVQRMLGDQKSDHFAKNFAGQWLYLRNLDSLSPDARLYPNFDDNLRQAFREETERFFISILRENRSVLSLIDSDYSFLNERLAKHYDVPGVFGSHFRRVSFEKDSHRGGLLRHGSILSVTSYANRTSPVLRGKWILENIIGTPPPAPPPNIPNLDNDTFAETLSIRGRLERHRADPTCATCHRLIDPIGFALQNYDALGGWRELDNERMIDNLGGLPDGSKAAGVEELEQGLLQHPETLAITITEKLLTYALGRGMQATDAPAVRQIVSMTRTNQFPLRSLIEEIVMSEPFQKRMPK